MCDGGKVRVPFEPVTIENEKLISIPLFLPYTDLESRENGTLSSFGTTEMSFESMTFEPVGYRCFLEDSVETNAMIKIKNFKSGPYQSSGFSFNFKRLFIFVKDLIMFVKVRFVYNPKTVCEQSGDVSGNNPKILVRSIKVTYLFDCVSISGTIMDNFLHDSLRGVRKTRTKTFMVGLKVINM